MVLGLVALIGVGGVILVMKAPPADESAGEAAPTATIAAAPTPEPVAPRARPVEAPDAATETAPQPPGARAPVRDPERWPAALDETLSRCDMGGLAVLATDCEGIACVSALEIPAGSEAQVRLPGLLGCDATRPLLGISTDKETAPVVRLEDHPCKNNGGRALLVGAIPVGADGRAPVDSEELQVIRRRMFDGVQCE